jgi:hypothetical protein
LSRDESDELGEGDFREVAFADGSSMKPRATEGMRSRSRGLADRGAVERQMVEIPETNDHEGK